MSKELSIHTIDIQFWVDASRRHYTGVECNEKVSSLVQYLASLHVMWEARSRFPNGERSYTLATVCGLCLCTSDWKGLPNHWCWGARIQYSSLNVSAVYSITGIGIMTIKIYSVKTLQLCISSKLNYDRSWRSQNNLVQLCLVLKKTLSFTHRLYIQMESQKTSKPLFWVEGNWAKCESALFV